MGSMYQRSIWLHTAYPLLPHTVRGIPQHTKHVQAPLENRVGELGCKHYRRRCKLVAPCCGEVFWCRHCHNEVKAANEWVRACGGHGCLS